MCRSDVACLRVWCESFFCHLQSSQFKNIYKVMWSLLFLSSLFFLLSSFFSLSNVILNLGAQNTETSHAKMFLTLSVRMAHTFFKKRIVWTAHNFFEQIARAVQTVHNFFFCFWTNRSNHSHSIPSHSHCYPFKNGIPNVFASEVTFTVFCFCFMKSASFSKI